MKGKIRMQINFKSSCLRDAEYTNGDLTVRFHHGHNYTYPDVPLSVVTALKNAESVGQFYNSYIKNLAYKKPDNDNWPPEAE